MSFHYFIAMKLDHSTKEWLDSWKPDINKYHLPYKTWVHKQDYHITLQFLGGIKEEKRNQLMDLLNRVEKLPAFATQITGLDYFGREDRPKVLYASVDKAQELEKLYLAIKAICKEIEIPVDSREYHPHITIAKKWTGKTEKIDKNIFNLKLNKLIYLSEVALYQINPRKEIKYQPIKVIPLQRGC